MIYFTTFIVTLLFAHIARAVPGCDDDVYPDEVYEPIYDDDQEPLPPIPPPHVKVTWDHKYDNPNGSIYSVACSSGPHGLFPPYRHFKDIPHFPFIGGKYGVKWGSPECGGCWELIHKKTGNRIRVTVIDSAPDATFDISEHAFKALNGGSATPRTIYADPHHISKHPC